MKLVLTSGQQAFFIADTHYNHANICSATTSWIPKGRNTREFASLEAMNDALVTNINEVVGEDDILIHVGDWSFGGFDSIAEFRNRIKCKNVHLVFGNHDHHQRKDKNGIRSVFTSCHDVLFLNIRRPGTDGKMEKYNFFCMHYPVASWPDMNAGVIHLHGHVHLPPHQRVADGKAMDVGVEGNGLKPISLDEVLDIMKTQPIKKLSLPSDHHEID